MMQLGTVTNLQTVRESKVAAGSSPLTGPQAQGSLPGEDNSRHVAIAILLVAGVAILGGYLNVKVQAGR